MIGTYYRLSFADEDVGTDKAESNSIQGQRGLVEGYIMARPELAAEPRQEYVDDGYSGTSTSRPAFQQLIQDAQDGKIKTIIVKDFSRFARDYIEAGDYMERIFPLLGVRFISVNDEYDSGMQAGNDVRGLEVAIKNIINASYSRDLSAKIAAADHVMQKKGMYLGGYRPFGFLPDPNDCHKLILDPVASRYVRLIFELALQGNRTGTIAKILNEKQIPTPAAWRVFLQHLKSCKNTRFLYSEFTGGVVDDYAFSCIYGHFRDRQGQHRWNLDRSDAVIVDAKPLLPYAVDLLRIEHFDLLNQFVQHPGRQFSRSGVLTDKTDKHICRHGTAALLLYFGAELFYFLRQLLLLVLIPPGHFCEAVIGELAGNIILIDALKKAVQFFITGKERS